MSMGLADLFDEIVELLRREQVFDGVHLDDANKLGATMIGCLLIDGVERLYWRWAY